MTLLKPNSLPDIAADNGKSLDEPNAHGPAVRQFSDVNYKPLCSTLQEIRDGIDDLDQQIVALLAKRALFVKDAARFKANRFQVSAPERQAAVFAKVKQLAISNNLGFEGFENIVEATYRTLVSEFIAHEQDYFSNALIPTNLS
jgi:isochorismate pyruvate lyase